VYVLEPWIDPRITHVIVKEEWFSRVHVQVEDYLHGIVSVVNELVSVLCRTSLLLR
jgi:hypothetical protein